MPHRALTAPPEASYFRFTPNGIQQTGNIQLCSCKRDVYQHIDDPQSNELRELRERAFSGIIFPWSLIRNNRCLSESWLSHNFGCPQTASTIFLSLFLSTTTFSFPSSPTPTLDFAFLPIQFFLLGNIWLHLPLWFRVFFKFFLDFLALDSWICHFHESWIQRCTSNLSR